MITTCTAVDATLESALENARTANARRALAHDAADVQAADGTAADFAAACLALERAVARWHRAIGAYRRVCWRPARHTGASCDGRLGIDLGGAS